MGDRRNRYPRNELAAQHRLLEKVILLAGRSDGTCDDVQHEGSAPIHDADRFGIRIPLLNATQNRERLGVIAHARPITSLGDVHNCGGYGAQRQRG